MNRPHDLMMNFALTRGKWIHDCIEHLIWMGSMKPHDLNSQAAALEYVGNGEVPRSCAWSFLLAAYNAGKNGRPLASEVLDREFSLGLK